MDSNKRKKVEDESKEEEATKMEEDTPGESKSASSSSGGPQVDMDSKMEASQSNKREIEASPGEDKSSKTRRTDDDTITRDEGESRGQVSKEMDIDNVDEDGWERIKENRREEKIRLVRFKSANQGRGIQLSRIQDEAGEFYLWETPKKAQSKLSVMKMNHIGGQGAVVGESKIWTNSKSVIEGLRSEMHRRSWRSRNQLNQIDEDLAEVIQKGIRHDLRAREVIGEIKLVETVKTKYQQAGILTIKSEDELVGI